MRFLDAADRMMLDLAPVSAASSAVVREEYSAYEDLLVFGRFGAIEEALTTGGLVPLPPDLQRFNVRVRLDGAVPIGEKDLANQARYVSARPAAIGCLLTIASRVTSGPIEITSLVRHTEYQESLRLTNNNAVTTVPMHTLGLAFDIAIVNTPLETVYEIRDVLLKMQAAGEILVVGERRQLVFHVVPHPSRLGAFTDAYVNAVTTGRVDGAADSVWARYVGANLPSTPLVDTAVIALYPTDEFAAEWWAVPDQPTDLSVEVSAGLPVMPLLTAMDETRAAVSRLATRCLNLVTGMFG